MAHVITIEVEKGFTEDCLVCPFCKNLTGYDVCGKPDDFPNCGDVNYAEMQVTNN